MRAYESMEFFFLLANGILTDARFITVYCKCTIVALKVLDSYAGRDYRSDLTIVLIFSMQSSFFLEIVISMSMNC